MTARTTTGIVLTQDHLTGDYRVTFPGNVVRAQLARDAAGDRPLDACQQAAGLRDGYWLRRGVSHLSYGFEWTWVQL